MYRVDLPSSYMVFTYWMFALTKPPPNGLSVLIHFTRWPIMQKVHRYFASKNTFTIGAALILYYSTAS